MQQPYTPTRHTTRTSPCLVQVVQHLRPGGIEMLSLNILKHASVPVHIISLEGDKADAIKQWPILAAYSDQLHFLNKPAKFRWKTVYRLRHLLDKLDATAIHSHHLGPLLYSKLARLNRPIKHVHTEHDAWHLDQLKQRWLTRLLLLMPTELVADAEQVGQDIQRKLGSAKPHTILNGIDTHYFCPGDAFRAKRDIDLNEETILIGCAGRLVAEKSLDTLIDALPLLPAQYKVMVAGDGPKRTQWQQMAVDAGVSERILWLGRVDDMRQFYRDIDLFCMPSVKEGLPLALLEAQACGCSVIASKVGAIPELINPETGILVQPKNSEQLANSILHYFSRSAQKNNAANNHRFVADKANIKTMVSQYEQLAFSH
ncbi:glycosyltransferase [Thaumasiovibrio sp. DFM-14]|uniref:glycosyltransferase n=1 Tax=Thaumasiovibrio sp. DFM-14 TaxID=3384792 RepID=UPI00399F25A4